MKHRRYKKKIFESLPLKNIIPNLATLSALLVGMTQIRFTLTEKWEFAVMSVVVAAFLDATDGRLARLFNSCSRFGAELDSLSDFAVFGVCPAITMYVYSLFKLGRMGWIIAAFYAVCMCLRLARFNTLDIENVKTPLTGKFFIGVPAPAGAILALFPIILFNAFNGDFFKNPYFCAINIVMTGILCISRLPTLSIKKFHIKREQYTIFLILVILFIGLIFSYTWKVFSITVIMYLISIFFCARKAKEILKRSNDKELKNK
jgi:CDP-diacylglycerol--serine O-phosphatidyltransferase